MSEEISAEMLGEPALKIDGLQLWVHGRQFPEATDMDDGNWLRVTAHCGKNGASVWVSGSILMASDIAVFSKACEKLLSGKTTIAELKPFERELRVKLEAVDKLGHLRMKIVVCPDMDQTHEFIFAIDQSYLPTAIEQCENILKDFPVRGPSRWLKRLGL